MQLLWYTHTSLATQYEPCHEKTYILYNYVKKAQIRGATEQGASLSLVMRKPDFCKCENKDADQLRGNREADQRLGFRYTNSTIPLLPNCENFKPLAIFCDCTARFVSDLVGNPEDRFSQNEAHFSLSRL